MVPIWIVKATASPASRPDGSRADQFITQCSRDRWNRTPSSIVCAIHEKAYIRTMATILTLDQQRTAGSAAEKVGGYAELIRLEIERRKAKGKGHIERDVRTGRVTFASKSKPAPTT